jgi:hypothetical protein
MADQARRSVEALACTLLQGGPGQAECVPYVFIPVLPHPLSLTSHSFLLGEEVGGMGGGMSREGGWCESDMTSTPVEMYWLSPPVGLRLKEVILILYPCRAQTCTSLSSYHLYPLSCLPLRLQPSLLLPPWHQQLQH